MLRGGGIDTLESILGILESLKIRALWFVLQVPQWIRKNGRNIKFVKAG